MVLYTKSIFLPVELEDGIRVSVMSRHTLDDGKTPDSRITPHLFNQWMKSLAPPDSLVGAYYRGEVSWNEYEQQYLQFLRRGETKIFVSNLTENALKQDITLLCVETSPDKCHRRLLAEECKRLEPRLVIGHK